MSTATLAADGLSALSSNNAPLAITKLTQALQSSSSPNLNPTWLIARSRAFNTTSNFQASLRDADLALHSAFGRGDKKSIITAHHRRAVAYNRLGELANADACCLYAMEGLAGKKVQPREDPAGEFTDADGYWMANAEKVEEYVYEHPLGEREKQRKKESAGGAGMEAEAMKTPTEDTKLFWLIAQLRNMVVKKLDTLPEKDEGRKRTAQMLPPKRQLYVPEGMQTEASTKSTEALETLPEKNDTSAAVPAAAPVQVPENAQLNIQSYETDTIMNATIFSKGVSKEGLKVHFTESTVALNPMKYPGGVEKECVISLNGSIKPAECTYRVTPSKVELKLVKAEAGKWKDVGEQGIAPPASQDQDETTFTPVASASIPSTKPKPTTETDTAPKSSAPTYPTSSRSGPVNWDKVVDLEDPDDEEGKDVNDFFKQIYQGADDDAKRAMMKSFVESNGTSLSTNWNEVEKGRVETVPPEGVEAKKW